MSTEKTENKTNNGRHPLFIFGGFVLLGLAMALLLFGGNLFSQGADAGDAVPVLQQVPQLNEGGAVLPNNAGPLAVGNVAHDFTLQDLDGNSYTLNDLRGRPVIINFWATWCAPCRVEMPELQAAFEKYEEDGLVILALDQDEPPDVVHDFFYNEMDLTFTPLLDDGGRVSQLYGVFNFPSTFFVNANGEITAIHRGLLVESQLDGYLVDILVTEG